MYGETAVLKSLDCTSPGLSPRVRGNRQRCVPCELSLRSIPACTGKPYECGSDASHARVYPRVYGETSSSGMLPVASSGLSPRVRGNPRPCLRLPRPCRSIPACTGKPRYPRIGTGLAEVYPRVYGETPRTINLPGSFEGLSPRVRGNRAGRAGRDRYLGSIPACTGKPVGTGRRGWVNGVYPRVYGETADRYARRAA